jgi:hypothetical protein
MSDYLIRPEHAAAFRAVSRRQGDILFRAEGQLRRQYRLAVDSGEVRPIIILVSRDGPLGRQVQANVVTRERGIELLAPICDDWDAMLAQVDQSQDLFLAACVEPGALTEAGYPVSGTLRLIPIAAGTDK